MKSLVLSLVLIGMSSFAHGRPNTTRMTCDQARELVQRSGAIVLATGTYTYDRYVAHSGYCGHSQATEPAWVPTRDRASCLVGYVCRHRDRD